MRIKDYDIGGNAPVYVIAEMSANYAMQEVWNKQKKLGADCIKIQTLGMKAQKDIAFGTPLSFDLLSD